MYNAPIYLNDQQFSSGYLVFAKFIKALDRDVDHNHPPRVSNVSKTAKRKNTHNFGRISVPKNCIPKNVCLQINRSFIKIVEDRVLTATKDAGRYTNVRMVITLIDCESLTIRAF